MKTVRLNHLRAALLAVAAAGLLATVGLFVVVLQAQPAEANFPGKPGKIAYAGFDGQDYEIYTIKPDGGGKKQLTDNSTSDRFPYYQPSGKRIAYTSDATGTDSEIYTIKPGGGGRQPVTDNANIDRDPYWGSQQRLLPPGAAGGVSFAEHRAREPGCAIARIPGSPFLEVALFPPPAMFPEVYIQHTA